MSQLIKNYLELKVNEGLTAGELFRYAWKRSHGRSPTNDENHEIIKTSDKYYAGKLDTTPQYVLDYILAGGKAKAPTKAYQVPGIFPACN